VESVLRDELASHLDKRYLITDSHHGFRLGYSSTSNLLTFLEMVTTCINSKMPVDAFFLDLAKAFDKIPHEWLVSKLKAHENSLVCNWIKVTALNYSLPRILLFVRFCLLFAIFQ